MICNNVLDSTNATVPHVLYRLGSAVASWSGGGGRQGGTHIRKQKLQVARLLELQLLADLDRAQPKLIEHLHESQSAQRSLRCIELCDHRQG